MLNLEPIPIEEIKDPELLELMAQAKELGVPDEKFILVLARVPTYAKSILKAMLLAHTQGNVSHSLKEMMRIQLANFAGDPYFSQLRSKRALAEGLTEEQIASASEDYEDNPKFSEADKVALRFSDQMYLDSQKVNSEFYTQMKEHYSDAQIMELGGMMVLHYGMQVFMRTLHNKTSQ
jgi:alkylhydroperoxidase family enzyme